MPESLPVPLAFLTGMAGTVEAIFFFMQIVKME